MGESGLRERERERKRKGEREVRHLKHEMEIGRK
jgi:hypothetical protein